MRKDLSILSESFPRNSLYAGIHRVIVLLLFLPVYVYKYR